LIDRIKDVHCPRNFTSCEAALEALAEGRAPEIILSDIGLPGMNGIETLYAIKNTKTTEHIPVFMYSTSDGYTHGALSLSMGAKKYIRKPGDMNDLERVFREILS